MYTYLIDGYNELSPLSDLEINFLPDLMNAIELLFVTYWNSVGNVEESEKAKRLAMWIFKEKFYLR